jgi:hypothetical protein
LFGVLFAQVWIAPLSFAGVKWLSQSRKRVIGGVRGRATGTKRSGAAQRGKRLSRAVRGGAAFVLFAWLVSH